MLYPLSYGSSNILRLLIQGVVELAVCGAQRTLEYASAPRHGSPSPESKYSDLTYCRCEALLIKM